MSPVRPDVELSNCLMRDHQPRHIYITVESDENCLSFFFQTSYCFPLLS